MECWMAGRIRLNRFANAQFKSDSADLWGKSGLLSILCDLPIAGWLGCFVRVFYSLRDSKNISRDLITNG